MLNIRAGSGHGLIPGPRTAAAPLPPPSTNTIFDPSSNDLSWAKKSQCILHFSSSITKNTTSTLRSPFLLPETTIVVQSSAGDGQNRAGQFYHYDVNTELQNKHNFCFTQHVPTVNWWTFGHRRTASSCCAIHEKVVSYQHHFANYKYSHRVKSTTQCNVLKL